jgi:hypothetical protein
LASPVNLDAQAQGPVGFDGAPADIALNLLAARIQDDAAVAAGLFGALVFGTVDEAAAGAAFTNKSTGLSRYRIFGAASRACRLEKPMDVALWADCLRSGVEYAVVCDMTFENALSDF